MTAVRVPLLALALGFALQPMPVHAQSDPLYDPARAITAGAPYPQVRTDMLAAGWALDLSRVEDSGRCGKHGHICMAFPEVSRCWIEAGQDQCWMEFLDPKGNILLVTVRFDGAGNLIVVERHFFSEGGAG